MAKILVVDDNVTNLNVARKALEDLYEVYPMISGEKALKFMQRVAPDLVLLDIEMPEMDGFEVLRKIKDMGSPFDQIPVIFVTGADDTSSEFEGLRLGAVDYVTKPFSFPLLLKRVELHLRQAEQQKMLQMHSLELENEVKDKTHKIEELQYSIVHVLSDMVERRDGSTGQHLIRTSEYLKVLLKRAKELDIYNGIFMDADIEVYAQASKLHDLGKIEVPDGILLKEGKLTDYEFEIMKSHTIEGENAILSAIELVGYSPFLEIAANFAGAHHEKWNGYGYPRGLKGEDIPICGRLMAIADVYDALISSRSYKPALTHERAVSILLDGDGTHFDPVLMDVFRDVQDQFEVISDKYKDEEKFFGTVGLVDVVK